MAAAAAVVLTAAVAYRVFWSSPGHAGATPGSAAAAAAGTTRKTGRNSAAALVWPRPAQDSTHPPLANGDGFIVVEGDGTMTTRPDFRNAVKSAIGSHGAILLLDDAPRKLTAADAVNASGGTLSIRAGTGVKPVLQVEVKGGKPFLSTTSNAALKIEGVTFEVTYVEPGATPAPFIQAGSNVTLDRCAFRLAAPVPGACALVVEGGTLTASGCWFENFDRALGLKLFGPSTSTVRQSMFVRTRPAAPAPAPAAPAPAPAPLSTGWALHLENMPGSFPRTSRNLVIDRCTVSGAGFLRLAGFSPTAPLKVELSATALAVESLVSWEPGTTADPRAGEAGKLDSAALGWTGHDNQYDVRGPAWVTLIATPGAAPVPRPEGPTDLVSWSRLAGESRPVSPPARFATDPARLPDRPGPADFGIAVPSPHPLGADPALVGPGALPLPGPK